MDRKSIDEERLQQLLLDGCLIAEPVHPLKRVDPRSVGRFRSFFSITTDVKTLLDPQNSSKFLVILGHPKSGARIEMLTSDEQTLRQVNKQLAYQNEQVGTLLRVRCGAVDHSHHEKQVCHGLDRLVQSLDGFSGWKFTLLESVPPAFQVEAKIPSTDSRDVEEFKDSLRTLLDYLAFSQQVGFYVQDLIVGPVRRCPLNPYVLAVGPTERLLDAVKPELRAEIQTILSSPKAKAAARGLNQAYAETFEPSRLSMLWAAAETVFDTEPDRLLSESEAEAITTAARSIQSLGDDAVRLKELRTALLDPQRLPLKSRNKRIAATIATVLEADEKEVYAKVSKASVLRGKELHRLTTKRGNMRASIDFLQETLRRYLTSQGLP